MKLGIAVAPKEALSSAFVVFRDDIEINIQKAQALGFDGVELALLDSSQIDVETVSDLCKECQLEIPMISSGQVYAQGGLCFSSPDEAIRTQAVARIKGLIDLAERFGSMVNIGRVRGPVETDEPYENSENRFLESLDEVARYAAPKGVLVAVEPVNRYELNFINNVSEAYDVISKLDLPNVKIMPDTFHMNIEDQSIEASFVTFKDHIAYIHFADSNRRAPGMGHLNFPNIISTLRATGYDGYVTAEILPFPSPDEAAQQAVKHLKPLIYT
jgi:sugar phosphate isomerase/epimerase